MAIYKPFTFRDTYTPEEGVPVFYNVVRTLSKIKNDCLTGVGSSVTLTAPANKFVSTISTDDANEQADAWLEANAQAYANNTGVCPMPFISKWKTDNVSVGSSLVNQVKLPLVASGTYDMVVEWGDGTISTITAWNQLEVTHTYAVPETYTIRINGICTGWQFNNTGDKLKILNITKFGPLKLGNLGEYFYGCSNLSLSSVTDTLNLTGTTSLVKAFKDCSSLNDSVPYMQNWDVSNITDMSYMLSGATNFQKDIGFWNTSNVKNMSYMFSGATNFQKDIGSWDTSQVEDMSYMFYGAKKFDKDLSNWNTSSVKYMKGMFKEAIAFNHDVGGSDDVHIWDTSKVEDMSEMFMGAVKFDKHLEYWKTGSVKDMSNMFNGAIAYDRSLPYNATEGYWDTSEVTNMSGMFKDAVEFSRDIDNWDVSKVKDMSYMFYGANSFSRDLSSWNTEKVENMSNMFNSTAYFSSNIGSWNVSKVADFTDFMALKTPSTLSSYHLNAIYNGWSTRAVKKPISISFGSARYTSASSAGRAILTSIPNNWTIIDGGI